MERSDDFDEYDSPGARKFADAARRHFGDKIPESAIKGVIMNLKDDVILSVLGMYIDEDQLFQLTVDRLLEVAVYLIYQVRSAERWEAEVEKQIAASGMEPDEYWGGLDYEFNQMNP